MLKMSSRGRDVQLSDRLLSSSRENISPSVSARATCIPAKSTGNLRTRDVPHEAFPLGRFVLHKRIDILSRKIGQYRCSL